ncbi:hypothetical protein RhiirC2_777602 [Rhizophagus irregularis]|uniref:Uncharacterized protein n=1 Tax=Rhizophagus irregularis TaxID=588596 RepID=A0A2N1NE40_9GLOM|nr:hypothetical protein RhiirC2_777602 [Rhizophagus irregularis]
MDYSDQWIKESYDEFIKKYGSRYEWDNEENSDLYQNGKDGMIFFSAQCKKSIIIIPCEESIVDYCLKAKKYNDIVKLCKDHFRSEFYSGLTRENMRCIAKNVYYCELVEMLI